MLQNYPVNIPREDSRPQGEEQTSFEIERCENSSSNELHSQKQLKEFEDTLRKKSKSHKQGRRYLNLMPSSKIQIAQPTTSTLELKSKFRDARINNESFLKISPFSNPIFPSRFEILVLGAPDCGSRCFASKFVGQSLSPEGQAARICAFNDSFVTVSINVARSPAGLSEGLVRQANGAIIVCDSTKTQSTVRRAFQWRREIDAARAVLGLPKLNCTLVATKYDTASSPKLGEKEIRDLIEKEGMEFSDFYFVSGLTGLNVDLAFKSLLKGFAYEKEVSISQQVIVEPTKSPTSTESPWGACKGGLSDNRESHCNIS